MTRTLLLLLLIAVASCRTTSTRMGGVAASPPPEVLPPASVTPRPAGEPTSSGSTGAPRDTPAPATMTQAPLPVATASPSPTPAATPTAAPTPEPAAEPPAFSYPIGLPGRLMGDGFFIRHGYMVENTWFNPGDWHTGEDWYATEGDTSGAGVYAVAEGEVVYVGANYPGRVVIVRHAADLVSMYGHLDPEVAVEVGGRLQRGDRLGAVLGRTDGVPSHLHFEIRTFLTMREVNGAAPRYPYRCGVDCPPGPGYWPFDADHPGAFGWRNPTHVIARRAWPDHGAGVLGEVVVPSAPVSSTATLWAEPPRAGVQPRRVAEVDLSPERRFLLLDVEAGPEDTRTTGAESYRLWYRIRLEDGSSGWVEAAVASTFEAGADGRPATILLNLLPAPAPAS